MTIVVLLVKRESTTKPPIRTNLNRDLNEFCGMEGIKREYSNARTPQKNGVAERKNRTLIEAARTMLADSLIHPVNAASASGTFSVVGPSSPHPDAFIHANTLLHVDQDDSQIPNLEDIAKIQSTGIFNSAYDDDLDIFNSRVQSVGEEADFNNVKSSTTVSPIHIHKTHLDHPKDQILGDPKSVVQTRGMAK
nr:putative ribonuclease H-like domain-containing protein [Tanacetum cinerariifolium]